MYFRYLQKVGFLVEKHIARVNGWVKYNEFNLLNYAFPDEIISYIKEMYQEAARRRDEYDLPSRDYKYIGGYDVFTLTPEIPFTRDYFISESEIHFDEIIEGYISSDKTPVTIFKYRNGQSLGLYLPVLKRENIIGF